jgi:hypothetical protein
MQPWHLSGHRASAGNTLPVGGHRASAGNTLSGAVAALVLATPFQAKYTAPWRQSKLVAQSLLVNTLGYIHTHNGDSHSL